MDKDEINQRVVEFADALQGPLGRMPLEKVLRMHIMIFHHLRQAGASWRQIAALMAKHGVTRKDGQPVDATQWAAMVSRSMRSSSITAAPATHSKPASTPIAAEIHSSRRNDIVRSRMRRASAARSEE
ncbi:MAG: hypothetical protein ACT6Q8_03835 [Niveispirillum sp.]|uniref:hypothetical protein n=1 Tax=Niveispirillum sp. TaxID=1917217 RepID=UPI004035FBF1